MFFIIGIFIAIFLSLLLLMKAKKSRADKILFVWLILISLLQTFRYFLESGYFFKHPNWLGVELVLPVLHSVLLYMYVIEITGNTIRKKSTVFLHFIPSIILVALITPFFQLTTEQKILVYQNNGEGFEWFVLIEGLIVVISGLTYSIWSLIIINRHQKNTENIFSNTEKKKLQWLKILSIGNGIIFILALFFETNVTYTAIAFLVLFIGFFGINQLNIFYSNTSVVETLDKEPLIEDKKVKKKEVFRKSISKKKYAKSGLTKNNVLEIYTALKELMDNKSYYKNSELTLVELAKILNVHPNYLSQVINEVEGKNFHNYINGLRIKEFIRLASIKDNKKYTVISLAYDCGFNTKSTFNKNFKLQTGKTPTEFFNS
ncbi:AraC family transcriptional regulator [Flavobacterium arcticum]|uniref:AraC family transcriptional regulator n=2 Tax=Flavobacterium arcticum TaxID=1784713 RepID=A0A345HDA3_9FLAO|nr:helix-turn-helix domain-containing protein [Flavobacterium arcticum]AXG74563.1 AraC family transcriptional regulator [Flavobacterium arcticum]KAF2512317.1 AraC family transcriptional regulator [Flavobacterium arcticum]